MFPTAASITEKLPRALRRHRLMTAWMALTHEPTLQLVRIRDNSFGYADMSDGFLRLIVIDQGFESDFFSIADAILANGGTFFDVGANHGLLSFGLAGRHGAAIDFHLFEPNQKLVSSIEKTFKLYPDMRLSVNQIAVGDVNGAVFLEIDQAQSGASHISTRQQGLEVPCVTIDEYIENRGVSSVELLKLDIEGFELTALRGAKVALGERKIKAIYFEYFEKWLERVAPPAELLIFLDSVGFETCFCRPGDYGTRGGASHALAGSGVPLLPVANFKLPGMTDLLAVPKESIVPVGRKY
jgi:FkbM family methyltransferase